MRAGEEVVITEAGVPLCRMVPVGTTSRYDELVASGVLRPPIERHTPQEIRAKSLELMGLTDE